MGVCFSSFLLPLYSLGITGQSGTSVAGLHDLALRLFNKFLNTLDAVDMIAVREELPGVGFLIDHLHADPTHHVLAALNSKRELHVLLMGLNARLEEGKRQEAQ